MDLVHQVLRSLSLPCAAVLRPPPPSTSSVAPDAIEEQEDANAAARASLPSLVVPNKSSKRPKEDFAALFSRFIDNVRTSLSLSVTYGVMLVCA